MADETIRVSARFPVSPERLYHAWLDSAEHSAFTGTQSQVDPTVGGAHSASDGYIQGRNLELEPGRRIVQSWRSSEFPEGAPDSKIELVLNRVDGGTELVLTHSAIPEGQGKMYEEGWQQYYLEPMQAYFTSGTPAETPAMAMPAMGGQTESGGDIWADDVTDVTEETDVMVSEQVAPSPAAATSKPTARKPAAKKPEKAKAAAKKPAKAKAAAKKPAKAKAAKKPAKAKATRRAAAKKPSAKKPAKKPAKKAAGAKKPAKAKKAGGKKAGGKKPAKKKAPAKKKSGRKR